MSGHRLKRFILNCLGWLKTTNSTKAEIEIMSTINALGSAIQQIRDQIIALADNRTTLLSIQAMLAANIQLENNLMSQITDFAGKEQSDLAAISASLDSIVTGIAALDALITNFQNSPGTLSAADQAALDAIQAASQALVTKAAAVSTTPPAPPAPAGGTPPPPAPPAPAPGA